MAESISHNTPPAGETDNRQKHPATALFKAIGTKLSEAKDAQRSRRDERKRTYADYKAPQSEEGEPAADIIRLMDDYEYGPAKLELITMFYLGDEKPALRVDDLELDEEQKLKMQRQGVNAGEEGEVYMAWRRLEILDNAPGWSHRDIEVKEVVELLSPQVADPPKDYTGPWGRVQVSRPLSPELSDFHDIAEMVENLTLSTEQNPHGVIHRQA